MKIKDMFINCYFKLEKEAYWKPMSEQEHVLAWKFLISDSEFNAFLNEYMDSLNEQCEKIIYPKYVETKLQYINIKK